MNQKGHMEKRKHPRIDHSVPVKISTPSFDLVAETRNISSSGVYCRVSKYLEPMTKLKITLLLPVRKNGKPATRKIICTGVVVRMESIPDEDVFNVAVFFCDINPRDSRLLADHVHGVLAV